MENSFSTMQECRNMPSLNHEMRTFSDASYALAPIQHTGTLKSYEQMTRRRRQAVTSLAGGITVGGVTSSRDGLRHDSHRHSSILPGQPLPENQPSSIVRTSTKVADIRLAIKLIRSAKERKWDMISNMPMM